MKTFCLKGLLLLYACSAIQCWAATAEEKEPVLTPVLVVHANTEYAIGIEESLPRLVLYSNGTMLFREGGWKYAVYYTAKIEPSEVKSLLDCLDDFIVSPYFEAVPAREDFPPWLGRNEIERRYASGSVGIFVLEDSLDGIFRNSPLSTWVDLYSALPYTLHSLVVKLSGIAARNDVQRATLNKNIFGYVLVPGFEHTVDFPSQYLRDSRYFWSAYTYLHHRWGFREAYGSTPENAAGKVKHLTAGLPLVEKPKLPIAPLLK